MEQQERDAQDEQVDMMRQQIQLLTSQFYRDRHAWLEEKRQLLLHANTQNSRRAANEGTGPAASQQVGYSQGGAASSASSAVTSSIDDSARLDDSFSSAQAWAAAMRQRTPQAAACNSPSPSIQAGTAASTSATTAAVAAGFAFNDNDGRVNLSALKHELETATAQRQELEAKSAVWAVERASLQRQLQALMQQLTHADGAAGEEREALAAALQAAEDEKEHLQAQLQMLVSTQRQHSASYSGLSMGGISRTASMASSAAAVNTSQEAAAAAAAAAAASRDAAAGSCTTPTAMARGADSPLPAALSRKTSPDAASEGASYCSAYSQLNPIEGLFGVRSLQYSTDPGMEGSTHKPAQSPSPSMGDPQLTVSPACTAATDALPTAPGTPEQVMPGAQDQNRQPNESLSGLGSHPVTLDSIGLPPAISERWSGRCSVLDPSDSSTPATTASRSLGACTGYGMGTASSSGMGAESDMVISLRGRMQQQQPWGMTLADSVSIPLLLQEKAALEKEVARYRDECVAVPRSQYAHLSTLNSQRAFLECELRALREDLAVCECAREASEGELQELLAEMGGVGGSGGGGGHAAVMVPAQEYQRLVRAAAEARAAHARGGTAAMPTTTTATVSISSSDHARLLASVHERDALAAALTARSGAGLVAEGEAGASAVLVETLEAALSAARVQHATLSVEVESLQASLAAAQAQAAAAAAAAAPALAAAEVRAGSAAAELRAALARARAAEADAALAKEQLAVAKADREAAYRELGAAQDRCLCLEQQAAEAQAAGKAGQAAARASHKEVLTLTEELVHVKMALAQAREMEVLFKRQVYKAKVRLHGTPIKDVQAVFNEAAAEAANASNGGAQLLPTGGSKVLGGTGVAG